MSGIPNCFQQEDTRSPGWFRWGVIALATLALCSCRGPLHSKKDACPAPAASPIPYQQAMAAPLPASSCACAACAVNVEPWRPPGLAGPWPADEYLCDGGDDTTPATVLADWSTRGVEPEDTLVHYDTLDGRTELRPSNRVCVYAPRFAAVRSVDGVQVNLQQDQVVGFDGPEKIVQYNDLQRAVIDVQPIQPHGQLGTRAASVYRERQLGKGITGEQHLAAFHDGFLPYEDFARIRIGTYDRTEQIRLMKQIDAANEWTQKQAVQVILDGKLAHELVDSDQAEEVYRLERGEGEVRICKVASKHAALPGETVDFTLRFDNVGSDRVGNVVILDNLTTRLEYVPGSAQSSLPAEFFAEENEAGSHILRWELTQPLEPGQGGVLRFRTRVR